MRKNLAALYIQMENNPEITRTISRDIKNTANKLRNCHSKIFEKKQDSLGYFGT